MSTETLPAQIKASIHQDAISRVSHFFDATITTITNELLQNSRRAGATRVDIKIMDREISIADDGAGIKDPASILTFGLSQWAKETADAESPAGMGLYALARRSKVRVQSKTADSDAWRVDLTPDHFIGRRSASIEPAEDHVQPHGTTIQFTGNIGDQYMITNAARHYPLPVYINSVQAPQEDFLNSAIHTEMWNGVRIGVYVSDNPLMYGQAGILNFYGTIVHRPNLPYVTTIRASWSVKVDVVDCPLLDLTLPARQEVVESPFADEMRAACTAAIYRAILLQPEPVDVPKEVQNHAADIGIDIPDARPLLEYWQPDSAAQKRYNARNPRGAVDENSILMTLDMSTADQQTLLRAASLNDVHTRLFRPNRQLVGYDWYDAMTQTTSYSITVSDQSGQHDLVTTREEQAEITPRPNHIEFAIETDSQGNQDTIRLFTDLAFDNDLCMDNVCPIVTQNSAISIPDLVQIMTLAYFRPSEEKDADSYETQAEMYQDAYSMTAIALLESEDQAIISTITDAVQKHIMSHVPPDSEVQIQVRRDEPVLVTIV